VNRHPADLVCPITPGPEAPRFSAVPDARGLHVNFGFWDVVRRRERHERGHFNRLVEREVDRLGGIKSLYSESFYPPQEFAGATAAAPTGPQGQIRSRRALSHALREVCAAPLTCAGAP
jgi:hypothetical protein